MAVQDPQNNTGFNREEWENTVEAPTYQRTEFINTIDEFQGKILNLGHVRKAARVLGTTLAQSDDGDNLNSVDPIGTAVTFSPVGRYCNAEWSANLKAQVDLDLNSEFAGNLEQGLAETLDTYGLAQVTSLTQFMSQANPDAGFWRQAVGRLMTNTNGAYGPGEDEMIRAIFSTTQYPAVVGIDEFTHADVRGDGENPNVKGIFAKGGGVNARFSTVVAQDANGWHCPLYVKPAFIVGWNERINAFEEQTELLFRVVLFANMGVTVQHDLRAIDMRFTASAL